MSWIDFFSFKIIFLLTIFSEKSQLKNVSTSRQWRFSNWKKNFLIVICKILFSERRLVKKILVFPPSFPSFIFIKLLSNIVHCLTGIAIQYNYNYICIIMSRKYFCWEFYFILLLLWYIFLFFLWSDCLISNVLVLF